MIKFDIVVDWHTGNRLERITPRKHARRPSAEPQPRFYPLEVEDTPTFLNEHRVRKRHSELLRNCYIARKIRLRKFIRDKRARQTE